MRPGAPLALALCLWARHRRRAGMRPFSTFRQWHGETRLDARLEYAAGALRVARRSARPSSTAWTCSYDEERFVPVSDFDAARGGVTLGLERPGEGGLRVVSQGQLRQTASVTFSPENDLALEVSSAPWTATSSSAACG